MGKNLIIVNLVCFLCSLKAYLYINCQQESVKDSRCGSSHYFQYYLLLIIHSRLSYNQYRNLQVRVHHFHGRYPERGIFINSHPHHTEFSSDPKTFSSRSLTSQRRFGGKAPPLLYMKRTFDHVTSLETRWECIYSSREVMRALREVPCPSMRITTTGMMVSQARFPEIRMLRMLQLWRQGRN